MPRNNSKTRKTERYASALVRQAKASYRNCGHWHTDNGYAKCTVAAQNPRPLPAVNV